MKAAAPGAAKTAGNDGALILHPESEGIIGLDADTYALARKKNELRNLVRETDALLKSMDEMELPITNALRNAVRRSDELSRSAAGHDATELAATQREINSLATRFKQSFDSQRAFTRATTGRRDDEGKP